MTNPAPLDLTIYQGDSHDIFFRLKARDGSGNMVYKDITGCTVKAQIRATKDAATPLAEYTATLSDQTTTTGGCLLHLDPDVTAAIVADLGVWDCEVGFSATDKKTILAGNVTFTKEVTR